MVVKISYIIFINTGNIRDWVPEEGDFMPTPPSPPPMTIFKGVQRYQNNDGGQGDKRNYLDLLPTSKMILKIYSVGKIHGEFFKMYFSGHCTVCL